MGGTVGERYYTGIQGIDMVTQFRLRWQRGPQIGTREMMRSFNQKNNVRTYGETQYSSWVWRNWRLQVVEGVEQQIAFIVETTGEVATERFSFVDKSR